ncbi:MAG TPA: radical SAM protein [Thermoanaerobaculia bacterium]
MIGPTADFDADPDRWIVERRGVRNPIDPSRAVAGFVEPERTERGEIADVATLFLVNRECPWRCLMCDLWKNTTTEPVPAGAIPLQIRQSLASLPPARRIKLYNSGSFFDRLAIPPADHGEIAGLLKGFDRVIVESHPVLVGESCLSFRDLLEGDLEVALGLETVHRSVLERLNKRMTVDDFRRAAERLQSNGISMRAFVLLGIPFVSPEESLFWACRSVEEAFDAGATAVAIIPTRTGNGAMEELENRGEFSPPDLSALEEASAFGVGLGRGRVFADLWEIARLRRCGECFAARVERVREQNLTQQIPPRVSCEACGYET